jgi:predicted transcriptional regulator
MSPAPSTPSETITPRDAVIEMVRRMPPDVSVADIMAELYLRQRVDEGLAQLAAGQGIPHDEVKRRLGRWLS